MGDRGPAPTPTAIKALEGYPGKRPVPENEPKPEPVLYDLPPPEHLTEAAKEEWIRIFPTLRVCGLMTTADLPAFTVYCSTWARWLDASKKINDSSVLIKHPTNEFYFQVNPYIKIERECADLLKNYMREFGLTPSARARLGVAIADVTPPRDGRGEGKPAPAIEAGEFTGMIGKG